MADTGKTLCFSGHRPNKLGGYSGRHAEQLQRNLANKLIAVIRRSYVAGFSTFISGGAVGVDQIAAQAVLQFREQNPVQLIIAAPFPSQPKLWSAGVREKYRVLLNMADQIIYCSGDPYSANKMQIRNEWMVDKSQAMIAVWDGSAGGTRNCTEYARNRIPILLIHPNTLREHWQI